eukprot:3242524-Amphidinium_carterae.1
MLCAVPRSAEQEPIFALALQAVQVLGTSHRVQVQQGGCSHHTKPPSLHFNPQGCEGFIGIRPQVKLSLRQMDRLPAQLD